MTTRHLREVEDPDSPQREPITTPQFTSSQEFFHHLHDQQDTPPRPVTFRPSDKHEYSVKPVRVGLLRLQPEAVSAIEELGLGVDEDMEPDDQLEPRLEIEKLRALAEEAIKQIREKYAVLEADLMGNLTPDEQEMLHFTRPECLKDNIPASSRNAALFGSSDSFEELKFVENRMASEIKTLRDEVDRLRKRVAESEGPSNRASMTSSLTGPNILSILKTMQPADSDNLEKCSEVILDTVEKDLQAREMQIRREAEERFEEEREAMKEAYEEQITRAVEETREQISEYWQAKAKKAKPEDIEKLRENLYVEIEGKLQREYEEKLKKRISQLAPKSKIEDSSSSELRERVQQLEAYKANQEVDFELRLAAEKEAWKQEITSIALEDRRIDLQREFDRKLAQRTAEIQDQSKAEVTELTQQFRSEAQVAIAQHLQRLSEETERKAEGMKSALREECLKELRSEREMRLSEALAARLSSQLEKDLRRDLTPRIERELRVNLEDTLRTQLRAEFEEVYETRKRELDAEMRTKLRAAQEKVEGRFEDDISRLLQEKTAKIEKDLRIKYKSKLERQQKQLETTLKQDFEQRLEEEKAELLRERNEVARLKSALNVQLKKFSTERKDELDKIRKQEAELERKSKELSYQVTRLQIHEGISATPEPKRPPQSSVTRPDRSHSPLIRQRESRISPQKYTGESELMSSLPRPLSPPQLSRTSPQSSERNDDKEQEFSQRLVPRYDSQDLVKALISKNLEEAQKEAVKTLQSTEKPPSISSSYYPRDFEPAQTIKQPAPASLYYRSKESDLRREGGSEPRPKSARHLLYQDLLKDHFMVIPGHKN